MQAYVVRTPGGPDVLEPAELPDPSPRPGWVLIAIKAFGLNRAEAITRAGGSGDAVPFPRVIGIECVGEVIDGGGTDLAPGQIVAAAMGGLGRAHDGSYATKTLARRENVFALRTGLDWTTLAAIPETYFTARGCLAVTGSLDRDGGQPPPRVLVRPGASALGLAIAQITGDLGGEVIGVTRSPGKRDRLLAGGMTDVLVSSRPVADQVRARWPEGPTAVVDTIASDATIADGLDALAGQGMLCLAGSLADSYATEPAGGAATAFARDDVTFYSSEGLTAAVDTAHLQTIVDKVEAGTYSANIDTVLPFDRLVEAHRRMEANEFAGKVVIAL
ncbi:MAG: zinc-binding dehydrogenase [Actinomycetota bacterium]